MPLVVSHAKLRHGHPSPRSGDRRVHRAGHSMECPGHLGGTAAHSEPDSPSRSSSSTALCSASSRTGSSSYETGTGFWPSRHPYNSSARCSPGWPSTSWDLDCSCGPLSATAIWEAPWSRPDRRCARWAFSFHTRVQGRHSTPLLRSLVSERLHSRSATSRRCTQPSTAARHSSPCSIRGPASRRGARNSWPARTMASAAAFPPSASCRSLFESWEQWSADVSESHTTYVPLIWFRSPRPLSSWVTAQLAILDAAALYLALLSRRVRPDSSPPLSARRLHLSRQYCPSNRDSYPVGRRPERWDLALI